MDKFLQTITDSIGTQLHDMTSTIVKNERRRRQTNKPMKESWIWHRNPWQRRTQHENRSDEAHEDQNQDETVITGFHNKTSESEIIQFLKETITEIGMTIEKTRIECPAKSITLAFIHFKISPTHMRHKRDNNNDNTRKNERLERKRRRKTQTLHRRWRCVTVSEKNWTKKQRWQQQQ